MNYQTLLFPHSVKVYESLTCPFLGSSRSPPYFMIDSFAPFVLLIGLIVCSALPSKKSRIESLFVYLWWSLYFVFIVAVMISLT